jgi:hypothetical protein
MPAWSGKDEFRQAPKLQQVLDSRGVEGSREVPPAAPDGNSQLNPISSGNSPLR